VPLEMLLELVERRRDDPREIEHQEQRRSTSHAGRPAGSKRSITHAARPRSLTPSVPPRDSPDSRESRLVGPGISSADPCRTRPLHITNVRVPQSAAASSRSRLGALADPRIPTPFGGDPPGRPRRAQARLAHPPLSGSAMLGGPQNRRAAGAPGLPGGIPSFSLMRGTHSTD
jgi:hypothetical protein